MDRSDRKRSGIDPRYRAMLEQLATASESVWKDILSLLIDNEPVAREERMPALAPAVEDRTDCEE